MKTQKFSSKILCLDVGLKHIGIAYSPNGSLVIPLLPVIRKNRDQAASEVNALLKEYTIDILVVGLPQGGSTSEEMERRIRHFIGLIPFEGKICFHDEWGSSKEADERLEGRLGKKREGKDDSLAALIILERFLATF